MAGGRTSVEGVYLLDVTIAGRVYRYATEGCEVVTADGETLVYAEGLSEPSLSYGSVIGVGDAAVGVEIQAEDVDFGLLVARGHALDRAPAVLRRWYPGRVLERARVVLRGLTSDPSYGALGEPLSLSVVRSMRSQTRTIPPPQAVIDETTWPVNPVGYGTHEIPEKALGSTYPMVIGAPGDVGADVIPVPCVPVAYGEYRAASLGSSKVIWLGGDATKVRLRLAGQDPPQDLDADVSSTADLLGRTVQYVLPRDSDIEGEYLVGFRSDSTYGGGLLWRGELLRGAGDILEWVLTTYYSGMVDLGRLRVVRERLNAYLVDTYINAPVNAYEWLLREVLPLLPVEMREGAQGVYPAVLRYDLTERDAVAHLDATAGSGRVTRVGPVVVLSDPANEITVEYRPVKESGSSWLGRVVLTGTAGVTAVDGTSTSDTRVIRDPLCTASQARYADSERGVSGVYPVRVQAGAVWDTSTAIAIARDIAARRAWPRRALQVVAGPWADDLEVGACVTFTDPDIHVEDAVCLVGDVTPGPGETMLDLLILDSPHTVGGRATR